MDLDPPHSPHMNVYGLIDMFAHQSSDAIQNGRSGSRVGRQYPAYTSQITWHRTIRVCLTVI